MSESKSRWWWILYLILCAVCCGFITASLGGCKARVPSPGPTPAPAADHSITLTWQQSFANNPSCSSTVAVSCISGFDEGYQSDPSTDVQLHTDSAQVCAGTTQPESCTSTFNGTLPIGNVTFYVKTQYKDQAGTAGETAAALSSAVPVGADPAQNVTAKIND